MKPSTALRVLALLLTASSASASAAAAAVATTAAATSPKATFHCPDGKTIQATFVGQEKVRLTLPSGKKVTLPRAASASGARYSDGKLTFWNKGDSALLTRADPVQGEETLYESCIAR